jgi:superfamily II helicase
MSKINQNRWDCTECGVNQGPNDLWFEGDVCGECNTEAENIKKKDNIEKTLIMLYARIGIDIPNNHEDITQYVFEDVCETADPDDWHSGDVSIGFRRWIEAQGEKS